MILPEMWDGKKRRALGASCVRCRGVYGHVERCALNGRYLNALPEQTHQQRGGLNESPGHSPLGASVCTPPEAMFPLVCGPSHH
jgi:hypothetical protein